MDKKDSFIVRKKYRKQIQKLTVNQKVELMECIFSYQLEWKYESEDWAVCMLLDIMIDERQNDEERYQEVCERNKNNWKLGWRPPKNHKNPVGFEKPKKADNDSDSDNDNDSDKKKYLEYVYLSDDEYKKISDRYWERVLKEFITRLNNWIWEKPKSKDRRDRNAYFTILARIRKDWIKEIPPKPPDNETWIYDLPF